MDDDSFEDSFESSSDSETHHEIVPAYTDREDLTQTYPTQVQNTVTTYDYPPAPVNVKSIISFQSRFHSQSSPVEVENSMVAHVQQQLGLVSDFIKKLIM